MVGAVTISGDHVRVITFEVLRRHQVKVEDSAGTPYEQLCREAIEQADENNCQGIQVNVTDIAVERIREVQQ